MLTVWKDLLKWCIEDFNPKKGVFCLKRYIDRSTLINKFRFAPTINVVRLVILLKLFFTLRYFLFSFKVLKSEETIGLWFDVVTRTTGYPGHNALAGIIEIQTIIFYYVMYFKYHKHLIELIMNTIFLRGDRRGKFFVKDTYCNEPVMSYVWKKSQTFISRFTILYALLGNILR